MWHRTGFVLSIAQCQLCDRYFVEYALPDEKYHFCRSCGTGRPELNYRPECTKPKSHEQETERLYESARECSVAERERKRVP